MKVVCKIDRVSDFSDKETFTRLRKCISSDEAMNVELGKEYIVYGIIVHGTIFV